MSTGHNPYTPPATIVEDLPERDNRQRPVTVVVAVSLLGAYFLFSVLSYLRVWYMFQSVRGTNLIVFGFQAAKWLMLVLACLNLWRGRHWARVLLLILTALSFQTVLVQVWLFNDAPAGVNYAIDPMAVVMLVLPPVVYLVAAFLVFIPGRAWFTRRRHATQ